MYCETFFVHYLHLWIMSVKISFVIKQQKLTNKQTMQAHGQISMSVIDLNHVYINCVLHVHWFHKCQTSLYYRFSQSKFLVLFLPSVVYKAPFQPCENHKAESLTASLTDSFATCPHGGHITVALSLSCCFISGIDCERISEYCAVFRMSENDLHLSLCMHCQNASQS